MRAGAGRQPINISLHPVGQPEPPVTIFLRKFSDPTGRFNLSGNGKRAFAYRVDTINSYQWHKILDNHQQNLGKEYPGAVVVLDCSLEGPPLIHGHVETLQRQLKLTSISRLVVLTQNKVYVKQLNELNDPRLRAVYLHSFLPFLCQGVENLVKKGMEYVNRTQSFSKKFTCLMNRARPHRIVVYGWLRMNGLLDEGHVSFHGAGANADFLVETALKLFPSFTSEIAAFTNAPYVNFDNSDSDNFITSVDIPAYRAPVSLVVESDMSNGEIQRFTEKSLKPIAAGHRLLIAGNPNTVGLLQNIGFRLPGFDSGYDEILNPDERLRALS